MHKFIIFINSLSFICIFIFFSDVAFASEIYDFSKVEALNFPSNNSDWKKSTKLDIRTDALLIWYKGKIVFEKYDRGYSEQSPHLLWSTTKSVLSSILGIAIAEKKINLDDSLCVYYTKAEFEFCDQMTVRSIVEWSSGLGWNEVYEQSLLHSSLAPLLYDVGHQDMMSFVLSHKLSSETQKKPVWRYSSADSMLLSGILKKALKNEYNDYPWKKLFEPLGIKSAVFEQDSKGVYIGAAYLYLTARDLLKYGELYLNNGQVGDQQILPTDWIKYTTTVTNAYKINPILLDQYSVPGAHWWTNQVSPHTKTKPLPSAPENMVFTRGHWGQHVLVFPTEKLIIVRFGDTRSHGVFKTNLFIENILEALNIPIIKSNEVVDPNLKLHPGFSDDVKYPNNSIYGIGPAFTAKEVCSCIFVEKQSPEFCKLKYKEISPWILPVSVDEEKKYVRTGLLYFFKSQKAVWDGERMGCRLL